MREEGSAAGYSVWGLPQPPTNLVDSLESHCGAVGLVGGEEQRQWFKVSLHVPSATPTAEREQQNIRFQIPHSLKPSYEIRLLRSSRLGDQANSSRKASDTVP